MPDGRVWVVDDVPKRLLLRRTVLQMLLGQFVSRRWDVSGERVLPVKRASFALAVALLGCAPEPKIEETEFAVALNVDLAASQKLPSGMYIRDQMEGTGSVAANGNTLTMRYTGWLANGAQFDSNQGRGFQFTLGEGVVIQGWDLGVKGMKTGGKRQLIIPPALGYGASGQGPIPPNAILVFDVTLVSQP